MIIESNLGLNTLNEIKNQSFKFGCVIPTFERQDYVNATFLSLSESYIPQDFLFITIDDCSQNDLIIPKKFLKSGFKYIQIKKSKNLGVANSLAIGFDMHQLLKCEYFINLDSDLEVSKNWLIILKQAFRAFGDKKCILTGFNSTNHPIIKRCCLYNIKRSIGGINLFFHHELYKIVRQSLTLYATATTWSDVLNKEECYGKNLKLHQNSNGWDWGLNRLCNDSGIALISTPTSVIQHLGKHGMNQNSGFFEIRRDFKKNNKKFCFIFPDNVENCGGYNIQNDILNIVNNNTVYETIKIKNSQTDKFIKENQHLKNDFIIVVFWGPLVDHQILKFKSWNIIYWAHSCGYKFFNLSQNIPIIAISRNTMQYFACHYNNPIFLLYSPIEIPSSNFKKDIDVFVQKRKCSTYVLDHLIPKIQKNKNLNVIVLAQWVNDRKDFLTLLGKSKIYIYDSKDYWRSHGLTEGLGIPPIEAAMSGCIVFSSLNSALSDVFDPLVNCFQLTGNIDYDFNNIDFCLNNYSLTQEKLQFNESEKFSVNSFLNKFEMIMNSVIKSFSEEK